jgi:spore coat polysaccharide biosynthesis protein SpsF
MKTVAVIQARMASTRLPGKVLLPLVDKPVLLHIVERVKRTNLVDEIVVATTQNESDKVLRQFCRSNNINYFAGSENDVLDRVYKSALASKADIIVDITGDCPLVDPVHIDKLVKALKHNIPYNGKCTTNCYKRTWPDGLDIIVYTKEALKYTNEDTEEPLDRMHGGWNVLHWVPSTSKWNWEANSFMCQPDLGLTLDTKEDYVVLQNIFTHFDKIGKDNTFSAEEVMYYIKENPGVITNKNVKRKIPGEG